MTTTYTHPTACVERYLNEIGRYPLLDRDEELAVANRALTGEAKAREILVQSNLRLVVKIALEYVGLGLPLPDLISEGNIGLVRASELFKPDMGAKFSTYAALWIKQRMRRAITNQSKSVRVPVWKSQLLRRVQANTDELTAQLGRKPTEDEISDLSGLSSDELSRLRDGSVQVLSLDAPLGSGQEENPEMSMGHSLPDENTQLPGESMGQEEILQEALASLEMLDDKELKILAMRFGLKGQEEQTLDSIGKDFKVSRERIRQLQEVALTKLRRKLQEDARHSPESKRRSALKNVNARLSKLFRRPKKTEEVC
ncbi:MAG: sigma-70 family RNA polymerase sigma factor [Blastochloris sp.]|nr:sigma-70 family RNA polymerase sigma factor [Blastochloris sp.]